MGGTTIKTPCAHCGNDVEKKTGHYNRSLKMGLKFYCNHTCAGLARRTSIEAKKAVKAAYDKKIADTPERKAARQRYFKKSYAANPEKYRKWRKKRYKYHLNYLRSSKYKAWKKEYDLKYRTKKQYGVYGEAAVMLFELEAMLEGKRPQIRIDKDCHNKTKKRKKVWKNLQQ